MVVFGYPFVSITQKEVRMRIFVLIIITLSILLSCKNEYKIEKKKVGDYIVEARFLKNGLIDGIAKYFDNENELSGYITYKEGIKNGLSVSYYKNLRIKDSISYFEGKKFGYWYHFDSAGNVKYIDNYYHDLSFGPELFFNNNKLIKYAFNDFNRFTITEIDYENNQIKKLYEFKMGLVITDKIVDGKGAQALFAYIPYVPFSHQKFSLGITDVNNNDSCLCVLNSTNVLFIDTILPVPPKGKFYYLSCHLQADNGSVNRVFVEQINPDNPNK